jgi:hypothetical protein
MQSGVGGTEQNNDNDKLQWKWCHHGEWRHSQYCVAEMFYVESDKLIIGCVQYLSFIKLPLPLVGWVSIIIITYWQYRLIQNGHQKLRLVTQWANDVTLFAIFAARFGVWVPRLGTRHSFLTPQCPYLQGQDYHVIHYRD